MPAVTMVAAWISADTGGFVGVPEVFMRGGERLAGYLSPVIRPVSHPVEHATELWLMALTTLVAIVAIGLAWRRYRRFKEEQPSGFGRLLENKWYVDELYDTVIVKPVNKLGVIANTYFEKSGIDALVNGVGRLVNYGGRQLRWLQSGQVGNYVLLMVISMLLFFVLEFFIRK